MRVDNERLCAMEPRLRLRRFRLERDSNSGLLDQQASANPTELPGPHNSEGNDLLLGTNSPLSREDLMTKSDIIQEAIRASAL